MLVSTTVTVMFNQERGLVTNKDEEMVREWKGPRDGKLAQPVIAQINEYIAVRITGCIAVSLVYKWQHESACLPLSPLQGVALPQLEESLTTDSGSQPDAEEIAVDAVAVCIMQQLSYNYKHTNTISYQIRAYFVTSFCSGGVFQELTAHTFRKPSSQVRKSSPRRSNEVDSSLWNKLWGTLQAACPAVLQRTVMEGETRRCRSHQIPYVSDLEYHHLISKPVSFKEQVTVVTEGCLDSFRLLKYDIASADAFTDHRGSLLEQRHNVAPGMFSAVGSGTKAESGQVPAELVAGCWRGAETAKREERLLEESKDLAKTRAVRDVRRVIGPSSAPGAAVSEQLLPEAVKPEEFLRPLPAQAPICGMCDLVRYRIATWVSLTQCCSVVSADAYSPRRPEHTDQTFSFVIVVARGKRFEEVLFLDGLRNSLTVDLWGLIIADVTAGVLQHTLGIILQNTGRISKESN
ncbi:hypothetical protein Anapl_11152 [Anas platyrhynchos]|uniref:Uncharacterized protein n=1 Tax=Anas platyrhynchos TaxID=8839 RepID=R0JUA6_ANAPL|nr:hypothetical protein Anapl_11152 [Anas platyrhynchos]